MTEKYLASAEDEAKLERARLVRLCARLTGNVDAAEDLAQEALFEAWRNAHKLHDLDGRARWLNAIARNVCLRWARNHGRDLSRMGQLQADEESADEFDVELELERDELADLLDRAMALLSPATRQVLVERYILDSPHAEIAARMGVSEDAISMRLTRGKLQLRRVLMTDLRDEAKAYGFYSLSHDDWQQTRIWCPRCGLQRLLARMPLPPGTTSFRCPSCHSDPEANGSDFRLTNILYAQLIGGLTRPRRVLNKTATWTRGYFDRELADSQRTCTHCGRPVFLRTYEPTASSPEWRLHAVCDACGEEVSTSRGGLVTALPQVHQFWREQQRIRALPEQEIETTGHKAVVSTYESVSNDARISVVTDLETLRVLAVHGTAHTSKR